MMRIGELRKAGSHSQKPEVPASLPALPCLSGRLVNRALSSLPGGASSSAAPPSAPRDAQTKTAPQVTCLTSLQLGPSLHLAHRARSPARPTRLLACLLACLPAGKRRAGWLGSEATRATRQPIGLGEQQPETRATRDTLPASALGLRSADPGWWRLGLEARNCQAASAKVGGAAVAGELGPLVTCAAAPWSPAARGPS